MFSWPCPQLNGLSGLCLPTIGVPIETNLWCSCFMSRYFDLCFHDPALSWTCFGSLFACYRNSNRNKSFMFMFSWTCIWVHVCMTLPSAKSAFGSLIACHRSSDRNKSFMFMFSGTNIWAQVFMSLPSANALGVFDCLPSEFQSKQILYVHVFMSRHSGSCFHDHALS